MIIKKWIRSDGKEGLHFWCPGCNEHHQVTTTPSGWQWNGDLEKVTLTPSVLVTCGHYMPSHKAGEECWCTYNEKQIAAGKEPSDWKCFCCHSFVREGRIEFLSDCTHALAGQTVDLPPLPRDYDEA